MYILSILNTKIKKIFIYMKMYIYLSSFIQKQTQHKLDRGVLAVLYNGLSFLGFGKI